ncbi:tyrosine-type recombinase/integrase [Agrilactobacillus yilanensis]|uniref:Tyrosine-type recombinase/integrase n=1 Tax=Agrilactobacillus yilanensis TaxID=2485997 RepID=A0ABW4J7L4_9LACO|nr:tyrosine-type recombinase/integrase [Agrilactobacillus yilanensis]
MIVTTGGYLVRPLKSTKEINELLAAIETMTFAKRNQFLFILGLNTGLQASDLVRLHVSDIIYSASPIIFEETTNRPRQLHLEGIQDQIKVYTQGMAPHYWLFPSRKKNKAGYVDHLKVRAVYQMFQVLSRLTGRDDLGTQTMRKTYGYFYYLRTKDLTDLQRQFNQSMPNYTLQYIDWQAEDEARSKSLDLGI